MDFDNLGMRTIFTQFTIAVANLSSRLEFAVRLCGPNENLLGSNDSAKQEAVDDVKSALSKVLSLLQSVGITPHLPMPAISLPQGQRDIVLQILIGQRHFLS